MSTKSYALRHKEQGLCRNCPRPLNLVSRTYCTYHLNKSRISKRKSDKINGLILKTECFQHYGNKCSCCGETILEFLTLEHENGQGNKHRKALFGHNVGGVHMYRWLKNNNYPEGYIILCMNCNWAQRYNTQCPHKAGGVA